MDVFDEYDFMLYHPQLEQVLTYRAHKIDEDDSTMYLRLQWEDDFDLGVLISSDDWAYTQEYMDILDNAVTFSNIDFTAQLCMFLTKYLLTDIIAVPIKNGEPDFTEAELLSRM